MHFERPSNLAAAFVRFTPAEAYGLRAEYAAGAAIGTLAKREGVGWHSMRRLVRGESYRHVPMPEVVK